MYTVVDVRRGWRAPRSCWHGRTTRRLEDVGVGAAPAGPAQQIAREVGEALLDLGEIPPPGPPPAAIADGGASGDAPGGHDVRAMLVRSEAPALAAVALRAGANADQVQVAGLGAGGDDVATAALVAGEVSSRWSSKRPRPRRT